MSCKDNKDGSCSVEYVPLTPGPYEVNITYGGEHIPGETHVCVDQSRCIEAQILLQWIKLFLHLNWTVRRRMYNENLDHVCPLLTPVED